ncbi:uncharacterized protein LOC114516738 [Dendronephthya gigantea]|uniref:uncharacterized protein LOC114516738 n=1 Tax=Dendronephthya gigantea TaxID=151771 RepID=UPI00106AC28E|nr:uncharacterized protein LOC114516738 [Dendronephthya gigantea]
MEAFRVLYTLLIVWSVRDLRLSDALPTEAIAEKSLQKRRGRPKSDLRCTPRMEGQLRFIAGGIQVCQSRSWSPISNLFSFPSRQGTLPTSCLDAKFKRLDRGKGDGFYWINPSGIDDLKNAIVVYCDMTSAGGGWMLAAKITHDYAWICPERKGSSCFNSEVDPLRSNLFHPAHARDFVDLRITSDENSGVHLKKTVLRKIFESGLQSVRFTFVTADSGWTPSEDAYAAFNRERTNTLFVDGNWVEYSAARQDYTWNVVKHERNTFKFSGSTLCWGSNVNTSYRFYEHGLHFGSAAQTGSKKCHLANDETEIMLKSHYAFVEGNGRSATWDRAQFGFLSSHVLQVPCKRIAIWIR